MDFSPTLTEQLELIRKRHKLKVEDMARIAQLPYSTYRRKFAQGTLTITDVERIANYFGYSLTLSKK